MKQAIFIITATSIICQNAWGDMPTFIPAQEPLVQTSRPKNNLYAMFDDSASIAAEKAYVSEHFSGHGLPACTKPANWSQVLASPKYANGNFYDPFESGGYVAYDPASAHPNFDGAVYVENCALMNRGEAFSILLKQFVSHFKNEYFLGFGGLGKNNTAAYSWHTYYQKNYPLIIQEVDDLSKLSNTNWQDIHEKIDKIFNADNTFTAWSPIMPALYNISLYFRNYPIPQKSLGTHQSYEYKTYDAPLKYRCARNSVVIFTDGKPNRSFLDIFAKKDVDSNSSTKFAKELEPAATKKSEGGGKLTIIKSYPTLLSANLVSSYYYDYISTLGYVEDGYTGSEDGKVYDERNSYIDYNRFEKAVYPISSALFTKLITQNLRTGYSNTPPSTDFTGKA